VLAQAVQNAVRFLVLDRHSDGIGKEGGGKSDRQYMSDLCGAELAEEGPPDSVMTTVAAVRALLAYGSLVNREDAGAAQAAGEQPGSAVGVAGAVYRPPEPHLPCLRFEVE